MQLISLSKLALLGGLLIGFSAAYADDEDDAQADVWAIVEAQWDADEKGDKKWIDRLLTEDFAGWAKSSPAPRSRTSVEMWDRFSDEQGKMVAHELYPLSIIVHDNIAIAHYLYTSAYEDKEGEVEVNNGRYTDVLVNGEGGWQFIAWHGGDDE